MNRNIVIAKVIEKLSIFDQPSGWISPHGKFYPCGAYEHNSKGKNLPANWDERGWLKVGTAGYFCVAGNSKILKNPKHPAIQTYRNLIKNAENEDLEITFVDTEELMNIDTRLFVKYGSLKKV